jgi:glycosyltransferase involved in cell wall biosynthesis
VTRVSIMIATRNRVAELLTTLQACLEQDWPSIEIIVGDDASTDGTSEVVRIRFPMVKLFRNE